MSGTDYYANVEVVNNNDTRFLNAKNGDLVFYTEASNQAIHFGNSTNDVASLTLSSNNVEFGADVFVRRDLVMRGLKLYKRLPDTTVLGNITQKVETVKGMDTSGYSVDFSLSNPQTKYRYYDEQQNLMFTISNQGQLQATMSNGVTLPNYTWMGDENTGLYHTKQGEIGVATNGQKTMWINSSNVNMTAPLVYADTNTSYVYDVVNIGNYPITGTDTRGQTLYVLLATIPLDSQSTLSSGALIISGTLGGETSTQTCGFTCYANSRGSFNVMCDRTGSIPTNVDIVIHRDSDNYMFHLKCNGKHQYNLNVKHGGSGAVLQTSFVATVTAPSGSYVNSIFNYTGLVMNNSNNLGIRTINPFYAIDANVTANDHVRVYSTNASSRASIMVANSNPSNESGYMFLQQDGIGVGYLDNFGGDIRLCGKGATILQTKDASNSNTNRMIVTANGFVGFNTMAPRELFHVDGGKSLFTNSNNSNLFVPSASQSVISTNSNVRNQMILGHSLSMSNNGILTYSHVTTDSSSNYFSLGLQGNDSIMNVTGSQKVGIRNTTPVSVLDVSGDINASSAIATASRIFTNKLYYVYNDEKPVTFFNNLDLSMIDFTTNFSMLFSWKLQNINQFGGTTSFAFGDKLGIHFINRKLSAGSGNQPSIRFDYNTPATTNGDAELAQGSNNLLTLNIGATWGAGINTPFTIWDNVPLVMSYNASDKKMTITIGGNDQALFNASTNLDLLKNRYSVTVTCDLSQMVTKKFFVTEFDSIGKVSQSFKSCRIVADYLELGTDKLQINNLTTTGSIKASGLNDNPDIPSFSWTNDPFTGFYHPGSNQIGMTVASEEKCIITKNWMKTTVPLVKERKDNQYPTDIMNLTHHEITGTTTSQMTYVLIAKMSNEAYSTINVGSLCISGVIGGSSSSDMAVFESVITTRGGLKAVTRMNGARSSSATILIYSNPSTNQYEVYIRVLGTHCYNLNLKTVGDSITLIKAPVYQWSAPSAILSEDIFDNATLTLNTNKQIVARRGDERLYPGYTWSNDEDTGFYHPEDSVVRMTSSGKDLMTWSNDRVGINTTVPKQALHVEGAIDSKGLVREWDREIPSQSLGAGASRRAFSLTPGFTLPSTASEMDAILRSGVLTGLDTRGTIGSDGQSANSGFVFSGYVLANVDGDYTFGVSASNAADLIVDGVPVTLAYGLSNTGRIWLRSGYHRFLYRVVTATQISPNIEMLWKTPGNSSLVTVPETNIFHDPTDLISASGSNTGIGVASPSACLHVARDVWSTNYLATTNGSSNAPVYAFSNSRNMGMYRVDPNTFGFALNGLPLFTLSNGKIGINQVSPSNTLNIAGDLLIDKTGGSQVIIRSRSNNDKSEIRFDRTAYGASGFSHIGHKAIANSNYFFIYTSNLGDPSIATDGDRLIVTQTGYIGINETNPITSLHIRNPVSKDCGIYFGSNDANGYSLLRNTDGDLEVSKSLWTDRQIVMSLTRNGSVVIGSNNTTTLQSSVAGKPVGCIFDVNVSEKGGMARIFSSNNINHATLSIQTTATPDTRKGLELQQDFTNGNAFIENGGLNMSFKTGGGAISFNKSDSTSALYIASDGNVGIGSGFNTQAPSSLLEVKGQVTIAAGTTNGLKIKTTDNNFSHIYTNATYSTCYVAHPTATHSFIIGSGSQAFLIDSSGRVGINTTSSLTERLEVRGNIKCSGSVTGSNITASNEFNLLGNMNWDSTAAIAMNVNANAEWRMQMARSASTIGGGSFGLTSDFLGIGTQNYIYRCFAHNGMVNMPKALVIGKVIDTNYTSIYELDVGGDINCNSLWINGVQASLSDIRFKEDLRIITNAIDKVETLTGYTFRYKDTDTVSTGLSAQDVQAVLPEAVVETEGKLALAYGNLAGLFVEALKDLKKEINALKDRFDALAQQLI